MPPLSAADEGDLTRIALPGLVSRLIDDVKDLASAEVNVYRAKVSERASAYQGAAIFFAIAGVLLLEALGALLVGLILTIATLLGPGWATLIVVGTVLAGAVGLALIGKSRLAPRPGAEQ